MLIKRAATLLVKTISQHKSAIVIIDPDYDGQSSAALLINYLYSLFPRWSSECLTWVLHEGKQHGLQDCLDKVYDYSLIIVPDAGSSDTKEMHELREGGSEIIVLDHHLTDTNPIEYADAAIINNQCCDYPNKELSGVGVTYQFCRYLDKLSNKKNADNYLDLVATGLIGDMMDLRSHETRYLVNQGLHSIRNPLIGAMVERNSYSLGDELTPIGVAFYIVPYINAMCRSGTPQEKEVMFEAMLESKAYQKIDSTKRGHKFGEQEQVLVQAVRTLTNVKNRQTKIQDSAMEYAETIISDNNLLSHRMILLLLENDEVMPAEIRGLVANKIMAKYNRPCCILTLKDGSYQGSARGCDKTGVKEFKDICESTGLVDYCAGHQGAFGLGILPKNIVSFVEAIDEKLKDVQDEVIYLVDYIFEGAENAIPQTIMDIANMNYLWGQGIEEAKVAIHSLKITKGMIKLMSPDKRPTIKISLLNGIDILKFNSSEEEYLSLLPNDTGYIEIDIVGTCNKNEWNGNVSPQILITDYEIISRAAYYF